MIHLLLLPLSISIIAANLVLAETDILRNDEHHFSVDVPAGWIPVANAELQSATEFAHKASAVKGSFVAGFRMRENDATSPFLLISISPNDTYGLSLDEIQKVVDVIHPNMQEYFKTAFKGELSQLEFGRPQLDRPRARFIAKMKMERPDGLTLISLNFSNYGTISKVGLHCYAIPNEYESMKSTFASVADSFRFDPGYGLKTESAKPNQWKHNFVVIGVALGFIIGAYLIAKTIKRLDQKRKH